MPLTLRNREIARVGTFSASTGKVTLTADDFQNIVKAWNALKGRYKFPLKLGHNDGQRLLKEDGLPAAGWLENVRTDGDKLYADFVDIPDGIAALIKQNSLRQVSIEFYRDVKLAGETYPIALTAVALLGEDLPAVDSLADVAALYAAASAEMPVFEAGKLYTLATEDAPEELNESADDDVEAILRTALEKAKERIKGKAGAPALRGLIAILEKQLAQVAGPTKGKSKEMDTKDIAAKLGLAETATEAEIMAALDAAVAKPEKKEDGATDGNIETLSASLADAQKKIIELEQVNALTAAKAEVDKAITSGKFLPASREALVKMAATAPDTFKELVATTPDGAALKTGEIGTSGDSKEPNEVIEELEPTELELSIGKKIGLSRTDLIRQKAADKGVTLPDDFGKEDAATDAAISKLADAILAKTKAS